MTKRKELRMNPSFRIAMGLDHTKKERWAHWMRMLRSGEYRIQHRIHKSNMDRPLNEGQASDGFPVDRILTRIYKKPWWKN